MGMLATGRTQAAVIAYPTSGTFTSNSVELTSNVVYAVDVGSSSAVTDSATGIIFGADNGTNLTESSSEGVSTNAVFMSATTGDAAFDSVLNTADFPSAFTHEITYTLNNLTIGNSYEFEVLLADTRPVYIGRLFTISQSNGSTPSLTETYAFANGSPAIGAYAIGTFVADATTQPFQILCQNAQPPVNDGDPDVGGQLNALILTSVPEPSTWAIAVALGIAVLAYRRLRLRLGN